jgi:hypothetical protein
MEISNQLVEKYNLKLSRKELEMLYTIAGSVSGRGRIRTLTDNIYEACENILNMNYTNHGDFKQQYGIIHNLNINDEN